jgi:hypothetical protein
VGGHGLAGHLQDREITASAPSSSRTVISFCSAAMTPSIASRLGVVNIVDSCLQG